MIRMDEALRRPAPGLDGRALRVVAAGGGTGLPRVLAGLAGGVESESGLPLDVTAVVTTADDGGSSGELRRLYGVPAPGDARRCLVALADGLSPLAEVFQHRFDGDGGLAGHTVGNVVLTALAQRLGDFGAAVEAAARLLAARGRVMPAAISTMDLVAELVDGRLARGETSIARADAPVRQVRLARPVAANPAAIEAVLGADLVVLGPGSLYSSLIASLLPAGLAEALRETAAARVLVVNLFTQPGETDGYSAADHVSAVQGHLGEVVDEALFHRGPLPVAASSGASASGAVPVAVDRAAVEALGVVPRSADLAAADGSGRHDPAKLAHALLEIARAR
jgi:uncharacterized cofD-like protein